MRKNSRKRMVEQDYNNMILLEINEQHPTLFSSAEKLKVV